MPTRLDPEERIEALLDKYEPRVKRQFLAMLKTIRAELDLATVERLLVGGQIDEALTLVRNHFISFVTSLNVVFTESAEEAAKFLSGLKLTVAFNVANTRAVSAIQQRQARLVTALTQQTRQTVTQALLDGTARGLNPRDQARLLRDSIGLTDTQEQWVQNYRRQLQEGRLSALSRQRRDRRFDSTVRRAIRDNKPLTATEIDKMVSRYRDRLLIYRSETIARTEALRGVHEGTKEMYEQAFESGQLDPNNVVQIWNTSGDARVRDTHEPMNGQQVAIGEAFISGEGNAIEYPGDPNAPQHESIQCRCIVSRRLTRL